MLVDDRDQVRVLTMYRPDKLNTLDNVLTTALLNALEAADIEPGVHALALGMVNRVVPDPQALQEALAMAAIIAA